MSHDGAGPAKGKHEWHRKSSTSGRTVIVPRFAKAGNIATKRAVWSNTTRMSAAIGWSPIGVLGLRYAASDWKHPISNQEIVLWKTALPRIRHASISITCVPELDWATNRAISW